ncbi:aldose epimerase family protein [Thalassotalea sp. PLHSN55]|uniref:aldose epimerase family protein n=1 Tax=Thalassotalea sp. PLHSN55 TaxID=3435888 RepID=UPI003F84FD90
MTDLISYTLRNAQGDEITLSNYGARLIQWKTKLNTQDRNVLLSYDSLEDYRQDTCYLGAVAGPYANRIANSSYKTDSQLVKLLANEGDNHLHGGNGAFADQCWQCLKHSDEQIVFSLSLPSNFNGYPSKIYAEVSYSLTEQSELIIEFTINSSAQVAIGPTSHPYFNLNEQSSDHLHWLTVQAQHYTPVNDQAIPTGEIAPVQNTDFDFTTQKAVSDDDNCMMLDHNFVVSEQDTSLSNVKAKQASLTSSDKKLSLLVSSNYPAIQVYNGKFLSEPFKPFAGICLEPQFCPNSPNEPQFPFHFTDRDQPLKTVISYQLVKHDN